MKKLTINKPVIRPKLTEPSTTLLKINSLSPEIRFKADLERRAREEDNDYLSGFNSYNATSFSLSEAVQLGEFTRTVFYNDGGLTGINIFPAPDEMVFDFDLVLRDVQVDMIDLTSDLSLPGFESGEFSGPTEAVFDRRLIIPRPLGNISLYMSSQA